MAAGDIAMLFASIVATLGGLEATNVREAAFFLGLSCRGLRLRGQRLHAGPEEEEIGHGRT